MLITARNKKGIYYHYGLIINYRQNSLSPEHIKKILLKECSIKDRTKERIDANEKEVLDGKGKVVLVDNLKKVKATIYDFRHFKSCLIVHKIDYIKVKINQLL